MEYREALGRNGWIPDPTDRVSAVPVHAPACPARRGRDCRCRPRVVLVPVGTTPPAAAPRLPLEYADTA